MKKIAAFIALLYCQLSTGYCQQSSYWQQRVNYKIDVTLNDVDNTLDGYVKMDYFNNSPDTLYFIWIHLWPNAYKNDRTAFSDQMLENGSTKFYFSNNDERGYINHLSFRVNTVNAKTEDHPQHQDIVKLVLPTPLAPKSSCKIETPFRVKLPLVFSRSGHNEQSYQVTQWYPKPAVYDSKGWHPIPYLDQGEFYSEFGNFDVQITLPENYVLAATGNLQEDKERLWLQKRKVFDRSGTDAKKKKTITLSKQIASSKNLKTLHYQQDNVHDFAWFADKTFSVKTDTLKLPSGKVISVYAYYFSENEDVWANSIQYTKQAILTKSRWLGEYPYNVVSVVDGGIGGGMEYPTITVLESGGTEKMLDFVINHEVGHNWFYGILASNERLHPWMDEGMNTYYDNRYLVQQYGNTSVDFVGLPNFLKKKMPLDYQDLYLRSLIAVKKDQPIETPSEKFNESNYNMVAYTKTGEWMSVLEKQLGQPLFDSCMKEYYRRWSFKHPYPEDVKQTFEQVSGKNLDADFALLDKKGALPDQPIKKDIRFTSFFNLKETDKHHYISLAPAIGYNFYDKYMLGILAHNYSLPATKFKFFVASLFGSKAGQISGVGRLSYSWFPGSNGQKAELSASGASFSGDTYADSTGKLNYLHVYKFTPSFKFVFGNKDPRSTITKFVQWKTFIINEQQVLFTRDDIRQIDIITYPIQTRYVNQLQFVVENKRVLYPYKGALQVEQGNGFVRTNFTGNYFFNYPKGGGLNLRFFAGKFFYTTDKTFLKQFETDIYHLNMTGPKGYEDYTYSNYFVGRNEFDKFSSQQIMIRDGAFKVRTDLLSSKIGKTDDWLTAVNLTTDIPKDINPLQVLPIKIPLKAFLDIGTYSEAWKKDAPSGRFLYDAGLQLSLFKDLVNIYIPILYSKVYRDYFKSTIPEKMFVKNIAFSIDIQNTSLRKWIPQIPF
ncbi:M1 family metallopeptidase [Ferruginibacter sp.]